MVQTAIPSIQIDTSCLFTNKYKIKDTFSLLYQTNKQRLVLFVLVGVDHASEGLFKGQCNLIHNVDNGGQKDTGRALIPNYVPFSQYSGLLQPPILTIKQLP